MLMGPACVSHDLVPEPGEPLQQATMVIALPLGGNEPGDAYYRSILAQMHEAYLEKNQELLATLLAQYDDPRAPDDPLAPDQGGDADE